MERCVSTIFFASPGRQLWGLPAFIKMWELSFLAPLGVQGPGAEDCSAIVEAGATGAFSKHTEKFWKAQNYSLCWFLMNPMGGCLPLWKISSMYLSMDLLPLECKGGNGIIIKKNPTIGAHTEWPTSPARSNGNLNYLRWLSCLLSAFCSDFIHGKLVFLSVHHK